MIDTRDIDILVALKNAIHASGLSVRYMFIYVMGQSPGIYYRMVREKRIPTIGQRILYLHIIKTINRLIKEGILEEKGSIVVGAAPVYKTGEYNNIIDKLLKSL